MNDDENVILTDQDGIPTSVLDVERLRADARRLAYSLTAHCDDEQAITNLMNAALAEWGQPAMGMLCAGALRVMATDVVSGLLDITDALGAEVRAKLAALAGEDQ